MAEVGAILGGFGIHSILSSAFWGDVPAACMTASHEEFLAAAHEWLEPREQNRRHAASLSGEQLFDLGAQLGVTRLGEVGAVGERDHRDVRAPADSARDIRRVDVCLEVHVFVVDAPPV
jgi:hypothetical protein